MAETNQGPGEKPKIIIDEDWKTQVEREKEALQRGAETSVPAAEPQAAPGAQSRAQQLPPPSFTMLVSMLATQAMFALGQLPNPVNNQREVRLDEAKHFVDLLGILQEKTKGNLSADENKLLDDMLYDLRMAFVTIQKQQPATARS